MFACSYRAGVKGDGAGSQQYHRPPFVIAVCVSAVLFGLPALRAVGSSTEKRAGDLLHAAPSVPVPADAEADAARVLARDVTIHRDGFGVPHIDGKTDESVAFGFAYAQAEDYFWQVEDTYILALGRCAEVHGSRGLNSDLLNRAFEVVPRSRADYPRMAADMRAFCAAFTAGLNFYLATHPDVKPRLIDHFEPWHVVAFRRQMVLELCYRYTRLSHSYLPRGNKRIWAATGSNAWAVSGARTESGGAMLLANPHMPWFGTGQMFEAHLRSGDNWSFTGATFYGSPIPGIGHNQHLGWTMTVNEPDVADAWRVTFDDPDNPLNYRYAGGYRAAHEWQETIRVRTRSGIQERKFTFRKTHHGPVVEKVDDQTCLVARISGLYDAAGLEQALRMVKATDLGEFQSALAMLQMPIMNVVYADCAGNIYYVYGGRVPRRDPAYDWSQPVDGSDPGAEWRGVHPLSDLPQVLNPPSGFVQSCNSTPFATTDGVALDGRAYPPYMIEDKDADTRRAKRSREILRAMAGIRFDQFQAAAFDTTVYWAKHELPQYAAHFERIKTTRPTLAREVEPFLGHLLDWDCRLALSSTQATLCEAWYEILYGTSYPGEQIKQRFAGDRTGQLAALVTAAEALQVMHGDWRVPYGAIHRIQRRPSTSDVLEVRFDDADPSLPTVGGHGPMGVIFTQYYTPSVHIPLVVSQRKRYGIVGPTYLAVYEFGRHGIRGASVVPFGQSGDVESRHYFDQAHLLAKARMKPILFAHADIKAGTVSSYHPGQ